VSYHLVLKFLSLLLLFGTSLFSNPSSTLLTPTQQQWVNAHPTIYACVEDTWAPFSYRNSNQALVGLSKDYLDTVTHNIGLKVVYRVYERWEDILKDTKAQKCDLLNGLYYTPKREKYIEYTIPYLQMKEYFFVRRGSPLVESLDDLKGKRVALVKGYAITEWLRAYDDPTIEIDEKESITACLYAISTGESDVYIGDTPSARYNMEKHFISDIVISGINKERIERKLCMGVKKSYAPLAEILSKSIAHLSEQEHKRIREKWMSEIQPKINWVFIGVLLGVVTLVVLLVLLFNWRLRKLVKLKTLELERLNGELEFKVQERTQALQQLNEQLQRSANTDPLTGIYNRRYFFDISKKILADAQKEGRVMSIAMMDIDHFKKINDTYGHDVGDRVIQKSVEVIKAHLRSEDIFIRFGGEEFLLLMPHTPPKEAQKRCEEIRKSIEASRMIDEKTEVTMSIGLSFLHPDDRDIDQIVKRADNALYQAKRGGRNRVELEEA